MIILTARAIRCRNLDWLVCALGSNPSRLYSWTALKGVSSSRCGQTWFETVPSFRKRPASQDFRILECPSYPHLSRLFCLILPPSTSLPVLNKLHKHFQCHILTFRSDLSANISKELRQFLLLPRKLVWDEKLQLRLQLDCCLVWQQPRPKMKAS